MLKFIGLVGRLLL